MFWIASPARSEGQENESDTLGTHIEAAPSHPISPLLYGLASKRLDNYSYSIIHIHISTETRSECHARGTSCCKLQQYAARML